MSISEIKREARNSLAGKWGKGVKILLAYLVFSLVIGLIVGLITRGTPVGNIITLLIEVPLSLGIVFAFIKLKREEHVNAFEFTNFGFANFSKSWKITLWMLLKMIIPFIFMIVSMVLVPLTSIIILRTNAIPGEISSSLSMFSMVSMILYFISLIWMLMVSLLYSLVWYIAYDNPNMTALEVVKESARMMKGNRGKLFLLDFSFIGWAILSVFTFGIGLLWLIPYMYVSNVCFYEQLLHKKENIDNPIVEQ